MGWLILGLGTGYVIGSFYPKKEFFVKYYNKAKDKIEE